MTLWQDDPEERDLEDCFDPLCVERSAPIGDEEAAVVEALCQEATPGPLVVDDEVQGEGAVVVSLPDGRLIVSRTASIEHTEDKDVTRANTELICKARYLLLRLLRDREQWKEERETLLQRIGKLEAELKRRQDAAQEAAWQDPHLLSPRPR